MSMVRWNGLTTVANFSMYSSGAPKDARPTTWQNWANDWSANSGTWPSTSWQISGSGVYNGLLPCLMYCVQWNTLNAKPARKSREESNPATGRSVNPVQSVPKIHLRNMNIVNGTGNISTILQMFIGMKVVLSKYREICKSRRLQGETDTRELDQSFMKRNVLLGGNYHFYHFYIPRN